MIKKQKFENRKFYQVRIEISARHIHLSKRDADRLFGFNHVFRKQRALSQPGEFATPDAVILLSQTFQLPVRVLAPFRQATQIELSRTDAINLGINPSLSSSGNLRNALDMKVKGPKGELILKKCAIVQQRHIHCSPEEASTIGVRPGQEVSVLVSGKRALRFDHVLVRTHPDFLLIMHVDADEGNAGGIMSGRTIGRIQIS